MGRFTRQTDRDPNEDFVVFAGRWITIYRNHNGTFEVPVKRRYQSRSSRKNALRRGKFRVNIFS